MAFRQPTFAPASRPTTLQEPNCNPTATLPSPPNTLEESQEWIIFPKARTNTENQTASTIQSPPTAGLSRLSDFGSLTARSRQEGGVPCEATDGSVVNDEDEDLDSLDDGLHAFQKPSLQRGLDQLDQSSAVFPRHDGLGTFPASGPPAQEQLWHFEQYNPRKRSLGGHQRRRSSVQRRLDALEDNEAGVIDNERRERIERWRLEHSRVLLDEIEKETRKRRASSLSQRPDHASSGAGAEQMTKDSVSAQTETRKLQTLAEQGPIVAEDSESIWQRITRRVIRDFIGIDDAMLSIIFGESLPSESPATHPSGSFPPPMSIRLNDSGSIAPNSPWEGRLLDRLTRELNVFIQHFSDHPGALGTKFNPATSDYAGMPVTVPTSSKTQPQRPIATTNVGATLASFDFNPTLQHAPLHSPTSTAESTHAALWGIEEEPQSGDQEDDREYWEQAPDLKTVFRFLHHRFTSQRRAATAAKPPLNIATTSTPDSLRRAVVIRQHHPLVSRAAATWEQRHGHARRHSLLRGRSGSSCASSIVGSARRNVAHRGGSLGSSSRNYWDLGGNTVGSGGSLAGVGAGIGAWGEI